MLQIFGGRKIAGVLATNRTNGYLLVRNYRFLLYQMIRGKYHLFLLDFRAQEKRGHRNT